MKDATFLDVTRTLVYKYTEKYVTIIFASIIFKLHSAFILANLSDVL